MLSLALIVLNVSLIKLSKTLLILTALEMAAILVLSNTMMMGTTQFLMMMVLFIFFVSESLIILCMLYSAMRLTGGTYGQLLFM